LIKIKRRKVKKIFSHSKDKKIFRLLPGSKQEIFQDDACYRVASKNFSKMAFATG